MCKYIYIYIVLSVYTYAHIYRDRYTHVHIYMSSCCWSPRGWYTVAFRKVTSVGSRGRSTDSTWVGGPMKDEKSGCGVVPTASHSHTLYVWYVYLQNWVILFGQMIGMLFCTWTVFWVPIAAKTITCCLGWKVVISTWMSKLWLMNGG